jgi:CHAT domain-containing protein
MDFQETCDFFGGTVFYEDLRGNFKTIRDELDLRQSHLAYVCVDDAASLLLLHGLWNLLSGNLGDAVQYLECLTDGDIWGSSWKFRGHVYMALLRTWREHPPLFRPCDINGPSKMTWCDPRSGRSASDALRYCQDYVGDVPAIEGLEFRVIREVCRFNQLTFNQARSLNPASEDYDDHEEERPVLIDNVKRAGDRLIGLIEATLTAELPLVSAYLFKLLYDLRHARGDPRASVFLEVLRKIYAALEDHHGLGLYWQIRGDHNASPPFTSPLVLNFDLIDGSDEFGGDSTMFRPSGRYEVSSGGDEVEAIELQGSPPANGRKARPSGSFRRQIRRLSQEWASIERYLKQAFRSGKLDDHESDLAPHTHRSTPDIDTLEPQDEIDRARQCYDKALRHFQDAGSIRASASVTLRRACLRMMMNLRSVMFWPHTADQVEVRATLKRVQNMSDASGDVQLGKLTMAHELLSSSMLPDEKVASRNISRWAEDTDNEIVGLHFALLGLKEALYFRYHTGSYKRSFIASEFSRQVIKSFSRFKYLWFQVMLFQISLSKSIGLRQRGMIWAGHLKDRWLRMVEDCYALHQREESQLAERTLRTGEITRFNIAKHALQATVGALTALDLNTDEKEEPRSPTVIGDILDWISKIFRDPVTQEWVDLQRFQIDYHRAMAFYRRHCQEGQYGEASHHLKAFLESPSARERTDLQSRLLVIEACITWGENDNACQILAMIGDDDQLPLLHTIPGHGRMAEVKTSATRLAVKSLELIFLACVRAKEWTRARRIMDRLEQASPGFFTGVTSYTKLWPWKRCLYAGLVLESEGRYNDAILYFLQAFSFFQTFQQFIILPEEQRSVWSSPEIARVVSSLTRRQLKWKLDQPDTTKLHATSDPRIDTRIFNLFSITAEYGDEDHWNEALLFLEAGRPRYVWRQALNESLSQAVTSTYYQYQLWMELRGKDVRSTDEESEFQRLNSSIPEITDLLESSALSFLGPAQLTAAFPLKLRQLYSAIPEDAIVIYYTVSEDGCAILAVDRTRVWTVVWNPSITPKLLQKVILLYLDALQEKSTSQGSQQEDRDVFTFYGDILSNLLIKPVQGTIEKRNHVIFIPSGDLARLPFGALKFKDDYLILQRQVSQVPSLTALYHLRHTRSPSARSDGSRSLFRVIARPGTPRDSFLPMAGIEAKLIAQLSGTAAINAKDVTRAEFQSHLQEADILHICTHGLIDATHYLNSHILLKERFRILDMLAVRTEVALVTFSACLSGLGHATDAGDVQGFSHALLAAGANAYIGALWEVNDVATMIHMHFFYVCLLVYMDSPSLAEAWQMATFMVYNLTTEEAVLWAEIAIKHWDTWEENGDDPNSFVKNGKKKLEALVRGWREGRVEMMLDFKHPKIWAAFILVGNGSLPMRSTGPEELEELLRTRMESDISSRL